MKKKIETETPVAPQETVENCVYKHLTDTADDGTDCLIKPWIAPAEEEEEPDDVYEGCAEGIIKEAIVKVADVLDDMANEMKSPEFHGDDRMVHLGLAGSIIQSAREAEARGLELIGSNIELAYQDEEGRILTFNKIIRNKTRLMVD